jgi:hypothetical protein
MQLVFTLFTIYLRRGAAKLFVCQTGATALSPGGYLCKVKITMQQCPPFPFLLLLVVMEGALMNNNLPALVFAVCVAVGWVRVSVTEIISQMGDQTRFLYVQRICLSVRPFDD